MGNTSTPSFVLTLKLNTGYHDEKELHDRFFYAFLMKNRLTSHARKRLRGMRQDKQYRSLMDRYHKLLGKDDDSSKKEFNLVKEQLSEIRLSYGLSEYQFHEWIAVQKNKYKGIDINTAQKIATSVWKAVEDVLFRKGKTVHFRKFDDMLSMEGKNNASGIRFKDGRLHWFKLCIQPQIRKGDAYAREALTRKVKYCRILRKPMGTKYHYYLQLVLEGTPPEKHKFLKKGNVGIDQGTSTEAVVSKKGCILTELSEERRDIETDISRIQRRMDRSRRASNPNNYKEDGTVKRGKKFKNSKAYKRDKMRLKTLYRRASDSSKQSAECLANEILCNHGSDIYTEPMNYRALQKRAKETERSEKASVVKKKDGTEITVHKYKKKKRYGKSIASHAPARFMSVLKRKLGYMGKTVTEVDIYKYKASQYNHVTNDYDKQELDERSKQIGKHHVQRDLYSAYLLMCASGTDKPDRKKCSRNFKQFIKHQNETIRNLLINNRKYPSSMGLKDFGYLLTQEK